MPSTTEHETAATEHATRMMCVEEDQKAQKALCVCVCV